MSKASLISWLAALLCLSAGCDPTAPSDASDPSEDAGRDAPRAADTPSLDAALDAGVDAPVEVDDVGSDDTGFEDGGLEDVGVEDDVGLEDGGIDDDGGPDVSDAGEPDAGILDASGPDTGSPDAGMADAGIADAGGPDAPPSAILLANGDDLPACGEYAGSIWPVIPSELGHYAATRLTPPSYPFVVDRVAYDLYGPLGRQCNEGFAHEVRIFVSSASRPPASPAASARLVATIPVAAGDPDDHTVTLDLTAPVALEAGEYLYIAVQLTGDATRSLCIGVCQVFAPVEGVDFWSNATNEPFAWSDMVVDYGFLSNYTIRAYGHVP